MNHPDDPTFQKSLEYEQRVNALVRAIANDLLKLGYVPDEKPGHIIYSDQISIRVVANETWRAMVDIQNGGEV
jgi:hypothetical protein